MSRARPLGIASLLVATALVGSPVGNAYGAVAKVEGFFEKVGDGLFVNGTRVAWPKTIPSAGPGAWVSGEGVLQDDGSVALAKVSVRTEAREPGEEAFLAKVGDELSSLKLKLNTLSERSLREYVTRVGEKLLPAYVDRRTAPFNFYIVEDSDPNAFSLPDGTVVLHTGLLTRLENEAQLAAVLGHEIAHVTHKHSYRTEKAAQKAKVALWTARIGAAVLTRNSRFGATLVSLGANLSLGAAINGHDRNLEDDADRVGLLYTFEAGYDPFQSIEVWRILAREEADPNRAVNWFFMDHSTHRARISNLTRECDRIYRGRPELAAATTNAKAYRTALLRHAARVAYEAGEYASAEESFLRLLEEDPADAEAHVYLGNIYRALEKGMRSDRAVAAYEKAASLAPQNATPYRELGLYAYFLGDYGQAAGYFETYLEKAGDAADAQDIREKIRSSRAFSGDAGRDVKKAGKPGPDVARWIEGLRQPSPRAREEALQEIRRLGPVAAGAVPSLLQAIDGAPDPGTRADLVRAIGFIGPEARAAVPKLTEIVKGNLELRETAIDALASIGPGAASAVPTLVSLLTDSKVGQRAAQALGRIGSGARSATPALVGLLRSTQSSVRITAAIALGDVGADRTTADTVSVALGLALADANTTVRQQAALSLAKLGREARAALPHLTQALRDENTFAHRHVAHALGEMGPAAASALPALKEKLADEDPATREAAAQAIRKVERK